VPLLGVLGQQAHQQQREEVQARGDAEDRPGVTRPSAKAAV
jgi:hypothetical protein